MKTLPILAVCVALAASVHAQIYFQYDASGCMMARSSNLFSAPLFEPAGLESFAGATSNGLLSVSVPVSASPGTSYQWLLNGNAIAGATGQSYAIGTAQLANLGKYQLVAGNALGVVTSAVINVSFLDSDGSGLPVAWELYYFGHTGVNPNADPDCDGVSNYGEYLDGTNPTNALSVKPRLNITSATGGSVSVAPFQAEYALNQTVTLTAQPNPGMVFYGWSGGVTNSNNPLQLAMNASKYITPVFGVSLGEALNATNLPWTSGGDADWFGEETVSFDGVSAAQSGPVGSFQQAWLQTALNEPGPVEVSFHWMVSTEEGTLAFTVNSNAIATLNAASQGWQYQSVFLPAGSNTLRWTYQNSDGDTETYDAGWVDEVQVVPLAGDSTLTGVVAWGDNSYLESTIPPGLSGAQAIAASYYGSLALSDAGAVTEWGVTTFSDTNPPPILSNVVAIAGGATHNLALNGQGTVIAWGDNTYGELNTPADLTNTVVIAAGMNFSLALNSSGTVVGWGQDNLGQTNVPASVVDAIAIAAGDSHALALTREGTVIGWGDNQNGQATVPASLTNVAAIAAGGNFSLALTRSGSVVGWGQNTYGQTTIPSTLSNVLAIACGEEFGLALVSGGGLVSWGEGFGENDLPPALTNVVAISARYAHGLALVNGGSPFISAQPLDEGVFGGGNVLLQVTAAGQPPLSFQWQFNGTNFPGATDAWLAISNAQAASAGNYRVIVSNSLGQTISAAAVVSIRDSAPVIAMQPANESAFTNASAVFFATIVGSQPLSYQWQFDGTNITGATAATLVLSNVSESTVGSYRLVVSNAFGTAISANSIFSLAFATVAAWGNDTSGQTNIPPNLDRVTSIASGQYFSLALNSDGTVTGWGDDSEGELSIPATLTNAVAIAAGGYTGVAATTTGGVTIWGSDLGGQYIVPPGLTNVVGVAAGYYHVVVLKSDGTVEAWGDNTYGQTNVPGGLSQIVEIAAGNYHTLALSSQGTVTAWGQNSSGQTNVPAGLTGVVAIAANASFSMALTGAGKVIVWGDNSYGESTVPTTLANVVAIAAGATFGLALGVNDKIIGWGYASASETVAPSDVNNILALAGGQEHTVALVNNGALAFSRQPLSATIWGGQKAVLNAGIASPLALSYQWLFNGTNLPGANNATLLIPNATSANSGSYSLLASTSGGQVMSSNALLTVIDAAPAILAQPAAQSLPLDSTAVFSVSAGSGIPVSYQWQLNQTNIVGATDSTLTLPDFAAVEAGNYRVILSNAYGVSISSNVALAAVPTLVKTWGGDFYNDAFVPPGLTNISAVAAGVEENLALTGSGTVIEWGSGTNAAPAITNGVAIACGNGFNLALGNDGTVYQWGYTGDGLTNVPPDLTNAAAIAAGQGFALAARTDGTVIGWGNDGSGQIDIPPGLANVVAVAAGYFHSLALKSDGTVVGWGDDTVGEIDIPPGVSNVVAIAGGVEFSMALTAGGNVFAWGDNDAGETNVPPRVEGAVAIAAGNYFCMALLSNQTVVVWGNNSYGELSLPPGLTNVVAISGGDDQAIAVVNSGAPFISRQILNTLAYGGAVAELQVGVVGAPPLSLQWQFNGANIPGATNLSLSLSDLQIGDSGQYRVVASNSLGQTISAPGTLTVINSGPVILGEPTNSGAAIGASATLSVDAAGSSPLSYQWRFDGANIAGATSSILVLGDVSAGSAGNYTVVVSNAFGAVTSSNAVFAAATTSVIAWGDNEYGQSSVPQGMPTITAISAGQDVTLALTSQGNVVTWGGGYSGDTNPPPNLSDVVAISAGIDFNLALTAGGVIRGWGENPNGQLDFPGALTSVSVMSAGRLFSVAVTSNGTVVAWGDNSYGELNIPSNVLSKGAVAVAAGAEHAVALLADNTVAVWGNNSYGQARVPNGLSNVVAIAAGDYYSLALRSNGTVVAWGNNSDEQTNVPADLTNVIAISAGSDFGLALTSQGAVVGWGDSDYGQTALPDGVSNVVGIACGSYHSVAILGGGAPFISRQPYNATLYSGMNALFSAGVAGQTPLSCQWQLNGTNIAGATGATLLVSNTQPADAGYYTLLVSNALGSASSSPAVLTVAPVLSIQFVAEPQSQTAALGSDAVFSVAVSGIGPFTYQWQENGSSINGATGTNLILTGLQALNDGSYSVIVSNEFGSVTSTNAVLTVVAGPSNDLFANRIAISGFSNVVTGSNNFATLEPGEAEITGNPGGSSVWWTWTSPNNGVATIDTSGSSFDTLLGVYTGTSVSSLTLVASDDDGSNTLASLVTFIAAQGTAYQISVDGYNGAQGNIVLALEEAPPGPPSILAPPESQTVGLGGFVSFSVSASSVFPISYQWEQAGVALPGVTNTVLSLDNLQTTNAGAYSVIVSNTFGSVTSAVATLTLVAGPVNDAFANRIAIPANGGTVSGSNLYATREPGEPFISGNSGGNSVWWTWTAPESGEVTLSTSGSLFDTLLGVYTGSSVSNLAWVASGNAGSNENGYFGSEVSFAATAGAAYQIVVDGYNGATGAIALSLKESQSQPAQIILLTAALQGGQIVLSFNTAAGSSYALQYTGRLSGQWNVLTNIAASLTNVVVSDSVTNSSGRFYRVVETVNH